MKEKVYQNLPRKVYNVDEVAEILQTSGETVRNLIKQGELKAIKIGRLLITENDLDSFLNLRERTIC